ncbi:hypothetical protein D918_06735 [Trichuris suis]|nr:hypothetical protein D918_06735 [Trichuris suis]
MALPLSSQGMAACGVPAVLDAKYELIGEIKFYYKRWRQKLRTLNNSVVILLMKSFRHSITPSEAHGYQVEGLITKLS